VLVALALPLFPAESPSTASTLWGIGAGMTGGAGVALLYYGFAVGRVSVVAPVTAVCSITIPSWWPRRWESGPALWRSRASPWRSHRWGCISRSEDPEGKLGAGFGRSPSPSPPGSQSARSSCASPARNRVGPLAAARRPRHLDARARGRRAPGKVPLVVPRRVLPTVAACGAFDMVANALYLVAVRDGPLGLVATLASLYPASTVLLARVVLGERLRPVQSLGLACAAAAIALITNG